MQRILDGWENEAIASELRLNIGTCYVNKHRAKKTLMKLLGMDAPPGARGLQHFTRRFPSALTPRSWEIVLVYGALLTRSRRRGFHGY